MKHQVAWAVPTHIPRKEHFLQFAQSAQEFLLDVDIYVIFSNKEEFLSQEYPAHWNLKPLFLSDWYSESDISLFIRVGSIINVKKFFALNKLGKDYAKVVVTDDEVKLFSPLTAREISEHIYTPFPLHSINTPYLKRIIAAPLALLDSSEQRDWLMNAFVSPCLYGWFADLPIYESDQLEKCLRIFKLDSAESLFRLTYETFDYVIYQYSYALEDESMARFKVINWESPQIESSWFEIGAKNESGKKFMAYDGMSRNPLWVSGIENRQYYPNSRMEFHTDRKHSPVSIFVKIKLKIAYEVRKLFSK